MGTTHLAWQLLGNPKLQLPCLQACAGCLLPTPVAGRVARKFPFTQGMNAPATLGSPNMTPYIAEQGKVYQAGDLHSAAALQWGHSHFGG